MKKKMYTGAFEKCVKGRVVAWGLKQNYIRGAVVPPRGCQGNTRFLQISPRGTV